MISEIISAGLITIVRGLVNLYTYTTLPIYYILQKPWKTLEKARATRAVQVDPKDPYSTWKRVGKVPTVSIVEEESIDRMLEKAAETLGKNYEICAVRAGLAKGSSYQWITYGQVLKRVNDIAKGLQLLGVEKGDLVLIFAETRLEWMLCAYAVYKIGASITTLFAQLGQEGIIHGINQTQVKYAITTRQQLIKLREVLPSTPSIRKIVDIDGVNIFDGDVEIISLKSLENNGRKSLIQLPKVSLNKRDDIAVIMYTSGTTGNPKGVIATHGQIISSVKSLLCVIWEIYNERHNQRYISYLPLGHMFEFIAEIFCYSVGIKLGYANAATLIDGAPGLGVNDISDVNLLKPTLMCTVPLVLDRLRRGVFDQLQSKPKFVRFLFNFLIEYKYCWRSRGYQTSICNYFLCRKARQQFGGSLKYMIVGGAPLAYETQKLSALIFDMILMQGFGGTEVCGASHAAALDELEFGHVGAPIYGCNVRLVDWTDGGYLVTDKPNPRGEILMNGDLVANGYYMMEKETAEAFKIEKNGERWYYSGDIGEVLPNGIFKIIDRRKDLVKLQNGEYFSLGKIEAALKSCSYVDNICVHGTSTYDFLVAVVVPNQKATEQLAKQFGLENHSLEQLCANKQIVSEVSAAIRKYGKKNGLSNREIPVMYTLTAIQWTPDNGMLTAALKLKRVIIFNNYKQEVQDMFNYCDVNNN